MSGGVEQLAREIYRTRDERQNGGRAVRHVEVRRKASYFFREWSLCGNPYQEQKKNTTKKYYTTSKLPRPSSSFKHHRTDSQGNTYYLLSSHSPLLAFRIAEPRPTKKYRDLNNP